MFGVITGEGNWKNFPVALMSGAKHPAALVPAAVQLRQEQRSLPAARLTVRLQERIPGGQNAFQGRWNASPEAKTHLGVAGTNPRRPKRISMALERIPGGQNAFRGSWNASPEAKTHFDGAGTNPRRPKRATDLLTGQVYDGTRARLCEAWHACEAEQRGPNVTVQLVSHFAPQRHRDHRVCREKRCRLCPKPKNTRGSVAAVPLWCKTAEETSEFLKNSEVS